MNNNSLVVKKKSIFNRIVNFFKGFFYKSNEMKESFNECENKEEEKEKFFRLYEAIKGKKISIDDLSISEIITFNAMLKEEIDIKLEKIQNKINVQF